MSSTTHTQEADSCNAGECFYNVKIRGEHFDLFKPQLSGKLQGSQVIYSSPPRNGITTIFPFCNQNSEAQVSHMTCWGRSKAKALRLGRPGFLHEGEFFTLSGCLLHGRICLSILPPIKQGILHIFNFFLQTCRECCICFLLCDFSAR